jgi:hypothetical protein
MRDKTLRILSFNLDCHRHGFHYKNDFINVVNAAITRGVENLSIDLCQYRSIMTLPTFVLTTKTLSVLKLKTVEITTSWDEDVVVHLPSLKVLHLESVCFAYHQHIKKFLSGCPIVEDFEAKDLTIPIKKKSTVHCQVDKYHIHNIGKWSEPTTVPKCLSSHLTTCTIRSYSRFNCGLQFAKYIMQNSRVLSTMTIQSSKSIDTRLQMLTELSLCPMISATCKLIFI